MSKGFHPRIYEVTSYNVLLDLHTCSIIVGLKNFLQIPNNFVQIYENCPNFFCNHKAIDFSKLLQILVYICRISLNGNSR